MNAIILLADGFEDIEALATRDVLLRGGITTFLVSINDSYIVKSSHGLDIKCDYLLKDYEDEIDAIILPGGKRGVDNLLKAKEIIKPLLDKTNKENKLICAICAAPSIFINFGYLDNHDFTCYTGFEKNHKGNKLDDGVVISKNIITSKSMYYSNDFGLAILEKLTTKENKDKIEKQIKSL